MNLVQIMERLKEKFEARKKEINVASYKRGYGWAMTCYYLDSMCIEEIESFVYNRHEHYSLGAKDALAKIISLEGATCKQQH